MSRSFIVLGDKTNHGGTVITADQTFKLHGKAVARVGDLTSCPQCKGTFPITSGAGDMQSQSQAPAREGDRTACGAVLIASQAVSTHAEQKIVAANTAATRAAETEVSAATASVAGAATSMNSGICLSCMVAAAKSGAAMIVRE